MFADGFAADEAGDAGKGLDVGAGGGFGTDEEEEEADGLAVEGIEVHGLARAAGGHAELGDRRGLAVRDGDAVADARGEDGFPLADGAEDLIRVVEPLVVAHESDQLLEQIVLRRPDEWNPDPLGGEQLRKQQASASKVAWFPKRRQGVKLADRENRIKPPKVGMSKSLRALAAALGLALAAAGQARAQQLLDWTVREGVEPEALTRGASAVFWNPAGLKQLSRRGEALGVALNSSNDLGLKGVAAAGGVQLSGGTAVAAGYQHFGIDDIERTGESPPQDSVSDPITVGEDRLAVGASQPVGRYASVGALVEYERSNAGGLVESGFAFGAGVQVQGSGSLAPTVGIAGTALSGSTRWRAGAGAEVPGTSRLPVPLRLAYGLSGDSDHPSRLAHRLAVTGNFREILVVSLAGIADRNDGGTAWTGAGMAEFRLGRYLIGVVHETLANDFGGATSVHLGVRF